MLRKFIQIWFTKNHFEKSVRLHQHSSPNKTIKSENNLTKKKNTKTSFNSWYSWEATKKSEFWFISTEYIHKKLNSSVYSSYRQTKYLQQIWLATIVVDPMVVKNDFFYCHKWIFNGCSSIAPYTCNDIFSISILNATCLAVVRYRDWSWLFAAYFITKKMLFAFWDNKRQQLRVFPEVKFFLLSEINSEKMF